MGGTPEDTLPLIFSGCSTAPVSQEGANWLNLVMRRTMTSKPDMERVCGALTLPS